MNWIKNIIGGLLTSKKFIVLISGLLVTLLAKFKLNIDATTVQEFVAMIIAYVIGQGIADSGKEAAKISAGQ